MFCSFCEGFELKPLVFRVKREASKRVFKLMFLLTGVIKGGACYVVAVY